MHIRLLIPVLLLCLPLRAGDSSESERAIALLKNKDVAARNEGTRLMNQEMRRLLAPFLKAMKDEDPEVRRRVAQAILNLVPHRDKQQGAPPANERDQFVIWVGNQAGFKRGNVVLGLPRVKIQAAQAQAAQLAQMLMFAQGKRHLKTLGASARFVMIGKVTGLQVVRVRQNRLAQKAGLQSLDIIVSANGVPIKSFEALGKALAKRKGWAGAKLKVQRGKETVEIKVP